jgi:hypothetical protein
MGLSEVMSSAPKNQISEFLNLIVPSIQNALSDSHVEVQEAAAKGNPKKKDRKKSFALSGQLFRQLLRRLFEVVVEVRRSTQKKTKICA